MRREWIISGEEMLVFLRYLLHFIFKKSGTCKDITLESSSRIGKQADFCLIRELFDIY